MGRQVNPQMGGEDILPGAGMKGHTINHNAIHIESNETMPGIGVHKAEFYPILRGIPQVASAVVMAV
jgi:hypothetical protein